MTFPLGVTTGYIHSITDNSWIWNGYAWDVDITGSIGNYVESVNGITGILGISAGTDVEISITGKTFTIASPTVYGVSGAIYASNLATGLLHGGIISINAGNSAAFDITSGRGQIHASGSTFTADPLPLLQYVNWSAQSGITLNYLATNDTTWLYVDSSGVINQRTQYYTDDQIENTIIIGQLVHPSRTYINLARTNPNVAYATDKQYEQFIRAFGPIKISGHTITSNGANLKLNRTSGKAFSLGRNWINNTDDPSVVSDGAYTDCIFYRYYRGATAGTFVTVPNQTVIDPTKIDDGTGILATVPGGKYTIQRLFYYPNTPTLLGVYYGRAQYTSLADAAANINLEPFTEIENTRTNAIFVGYLIVKSGATDLSNTSDALILQAGSFRSTTSGGGSVSLTLDDLTDVIITSPSDYQLLTYVDGLTGWENKSISQLPLVASINGSTGAITNVAKTNTVNTFSQLQTFSSGITSYGANFTRGVTLFAGTTSTPPLLFQSGASLTTPTSGAVEFNNLVFYGTSVAGRGLIPIEHINIINSDYSLSSITTSQQVFPTANMGLNSNTAYLMEGEYALQTGTIAHTTSVLFDYFTIGSSPTGYFSAKTFAVASSGTITRSVDNVFFDNINGGVVSTSSGSARTVVSFRGIVFVTDACSMVPKISFSVAPGGTNLVKVGSFIKLIPLGTNTMSTIGYWF